MTPSAESRRAGKVPESPPRGRPAPRPRASPTSGAGAFPGLRREEVAFLAGVSSDYYVRLEQGRDKNPSEQVLLAIARALQLDDDASAYLLQLARAGHPPQEAHPQAGDKSATASASSSTAGR